MLLVSVKEIQDEWASLDGYITHRSLRDTAITTFLNFSQARTSKVPLTKPTLAFGLQVDFDGNSFI